jgi:hypothetical protein
MLDQIDELRSDQVKFLKDVKETGDKAAQVLRQEVDASQAKLVAQVGDTLKANTAPSELAQRVDVMKKDVDAVKKTIEEGQQNISPGFALIAALVALVLGPFIAYKFTANQLAAAKQQAAADAGAAAPPHGASTIEAESPLAPAAAAEPQQEDFMQHEAPSVGEEGSTHQDADGHQQTAPDPEKV